MCHNYQPLVAMLKHLTSAFALLLYFFVLPSSLIGGEIETRSKATNLQQKGSYKEALALYRQLLADPANSSPAQDLAMAETSLQQLNRTAEIDDLLEHSIATFPKNSDLLHMAGIRYLHIPHHGYIVAGKFKRGHARGGGQYADATERDRTRSLQLLLASLAAAADTPNKTYTRQHTLKQIAITIGHQRSGRSAWKLQSLTDLKTLPDYELGNRWSRGGRDPLGAPVTSDGKPLYYPIPTSWETAKDDGERWRWALAQQNDGQQNDSTDQQWADFLHSQFEDDGERWRWALAQQSGGQQNDSTDQQWADFLHSQFGVRTLASYSWFSSMDMAEQNGILQLHTLKDNETIAKLANGVKRFTQPDDQNFITIYRGLSTRNEYAADKLIQIYLDRRQHGKSVSLLKSTIDQFPESKLLEFRKKLLAQIIGNWGRFEASNGAFPAGKEPAIDYVFRNAKSVTLTVRPVDTESMVNNLWKYIETNPRNLKWNLLQLTNLSDQVVNDTRKKYVGKEIARRIHTLKPRSNHWDARATLSIPVSKPGAYLVSALLEDGTTSHTVVWIDSTAIVRKDLKQGILFYVADAITGKRIPSAKLEFFGYHKVYLNNSEDFSQTQHPQ